MADLRRLEGIRFVGARDSMLVYDTEESDQADEISTRLEADDLIALKLVQTFAPDTLEEARNRGFRPAR